jgi:hypothetical protein
MTDHIGDANEKVALASQREAGLREALELGRDVVEGVLVQTVLDEPLRSLAHSFHEQADVLLTDAPARQRAPEGVDRPDPAFLLADAQARQRGEKLDGSPRRETVPTEPLWCVHVIGPDEVHPAPSLRTAAIWAHRLNCSVLGRMPPERDTDDNYVMCFANVTQWPHSDEQHAAGLEQAAREFDAPARQRDGSPRREMGNGLSESEFKPQAVAARVAQEVAELPDRTSPEDWPEAMLVTEMELSSIVETAVRDYCFKDAAPPPDSATASGETRVTEEMKRIAWKTYTSFPYGGYTAVCSALEAAIASIQPTPATGVDRMGVEARVPRSGRAVQITKEEADQREARGLHVEWAEGVGLHYFPEETAR